MASDSDYSTMKAKAHEEQKLRSFDALQEDFCSLASYKGWNLDLSVHST